MTVSRRRDWGGRKFKHCIAASVCTRNNSNFTWGAKNYRLSKITDHEMSVGHVKEIFRQKG